MKPNIQLLIIVLGLSSSLSFLILVLTFITMPYGLAFGWSLLTLLQALNLYCFSRLYRLGVISPKQVYEYLKNTQL